MVTNATHTEIRIKGRNTSVPSLRICDRTIISTGKWVRTAAVHDETFVEGEIVSDPERFLAELKQWEVKPDIFHVLPKIHRPDNPGSPILSGGTISLLFPSPPTRTG